MTWSKTVEDVEYGLALEWDSVEKRAEQDDANTVQVECPACTGHGCRACAGEGWVWALDVDAAAEVAFRQAAAAFLHPSGLADR